MSSAANNLGSLPQGFETVYTDILTGSSDKVATLAKRVDAAANLDQADFAPM
jgi:hypothetical protein